jgi:hypothetical protein
MARKTLSVSLEADRDYVRALGILAENQGTTIGELTRRATDAMFGDELKPLVIFFAKGVLQKEHSVCNQNDGGAA